MYKMLQFACRECGAEHEFLIDTNNLEDEVQNCAAVVSEDGLVCGGDMHPVISAPGKGNTEATAELV